MISLVLLLTGVFAVHQLQNLVASALCREVDVFAEVWLFGNGVEDVLIQNHYANLVCGPDSYLNLPDMIAQCEMGTNAINIELSKTETYRDIVPQRIGSPISKLAPTPNIDRLAERGMKFNEAFVENSLSTPSRACLADPGTCFLPRLSRHPCRRSESACNARCAQSSVYLYVRLYHVLLV